MDLFKQDLPLGPDTVGALAYDLFGPEAELLEKISKDEPLLFLFGSGALVPGLERGLTGKRAGDQLRMDLSPGEAYGDYDPDKVFYVPRTNFPEGELKPGTMMGATDAAGQDTTFWITEVEDERVIVNENHPLAGVALTYAVEVLGVRSATPAEIKSQRLIEG